MKYSGIVRRIDDLGRVVIPKEIRRLIGIVEGDPLELFYNESENSVTFVAYDTKTSARCLIEKTKRQFREYDELPSEVKSKVLDCLDEAINCL